MNWVFIEAISFLLDLCPSPCPSCCDSVPRTDQWRGHCGVFGAGGPWNVLAPSLLCVFGVWRAAGGPHLLPPGWQDLMRPPPRREAQAPLLRLRRGQCHDPWPPWPLTSWHICPSWGSITQFGSGRSVLTTVTSPPCMCVCGVQTRRETDERH